MKKMLALAAMAMMTAAVQAIQVGWTDYSGDSNWVYVKNVANTGVNFNLNDVKYTSTATGITGTSGSLDTGKLPIYSLAFAIFSSGDWNEAAEQTISLVIADANKNVLATSSATDYTSNMGSGKNSVWPGTTDKGYLVFNFDDVELTNGTDYTLYFVQTGSNVGETIDASDTYYSGEGRLHMTNTDASYRTVVPEPTCLALLALGVAGLALKRKVK